MSKFWLALESSPGTPQIDFSNPDVLVIPIVPLQTGGSRTSLTPGIYRSPRIRSGATKFGTATNLTDAKEISFPALMYGATMDDIYAKWKQIQFYLERAEIAANPFPRGTGIVYVEQVNDAAEMTVWDVMSGVLTDVDFNLPDTDIEAALVQLAVLPFSRGLPAIAAFGTTRVNGSGASYYLPYPGGDAPGLFEMRLKDLSTAGHEITWVSIGRRWYPTMAQNDFSPYYAGNGVITTTQSWQQILNLVGAIYGTVEYGTTEYGTTAGTAAFTNNPGSQQTGLFGVYAVVVDSSLVIGDPTGVSVRATLGTGTLDNGFIEVVLVPKDGAGNPASATARQSLTFENPNQPGDVQDAEDFESGTWNSWLSPPSTTIASGGSAALSIDATAAINGGLGAHFNVTGNSTAASITSASASRLMPNITAEGLQSIAFQIKPVSWGSWTTASPIAAPSAPSVSTSPVTFLAPPGIVARTPVLDASGFPPGDTGIAITWVNSVGETTLGTVNALRETFYAGFSTIVPTLPAGATGANIYANWNGGPFYLINPSPIGAGGYYVTPSPYTTQPPTTNTTGSASTNFSGGITYDVGLTWSTVYGETTISALTSFVDGSGSNFNATVTIPAFPAGATKANVYVSLGGSGAIVSFMASAFAAGPLNLVQGNGTGLPPAANTAYTTVPGFDATPRFQWGSLAIVPSGAQNHFNLMISGVQVGGVFSLDPGAVHQIGANFQILGTQAAYQLIVDDVPIGGRTDAISATFLPPVSATFTAVGAGTGGPFTEEWYLDEIHVYDELLQPGFRTIGSSAVLNFTPDANTVSVDAYYAFHGPLSTAVVQWYRIQDVISPYTLSSPIPAGAIPVTGPPTVAPLTSYAQLQARIGVGSAPVTWLPKRVVRTKVASGAAELVRLDSIELPPGAKSDTRSLDGWTLQIWGKSGASNSSGLRIKGIYLFPEDEDGNVDITASAYGLTTNGVIWHIGTNRFNRPYAQLFASDGTTLIGYGKVNGAIGSMAGDQDFVVLTGRLDANGNVLIDDNQQFQLGHQVIPRQYFEETAVGRP